MCRDQAVRVPFSISRSTGKIRGSRVANGEPSKYISFPRVRSRENVDSTGRIHLQEIHKLPNPYNVPSHLSSVNCPSWKRRRRRRKQEEKKNKNQSFSELVIFFFRRNETIKNQEWVGIESRK